jgi:enamine deaminase RidA (YjgF/YER057c/UK114 family)
MEKKIIHTSNAPEAIGPYSQAAQIGNMLFMSGQIAINPKSGVLEMTDISTETHQVMKNILGERILGLPGDVRVDREIAWSKVPRN